MPDHKTRYPLRRHETQKYYRTNETEKVRIVDFGDTLTEVLKAARKEQLKNRMQYGELYHRNYYKEVHVKNRVYYEYYHLDGTQEIPTDYKGNLLCLPATRWLFGTAEYTQHCMQISGKEAGRI